MDDNESVGGKLEGKITRLRDYLRHHAKVAVAFSGGVDSTVLLHNCIKALQPDKVMALHARSCLLGKSAQENVEKVIAAHFQGLCDFRVIDCHPLDWPDFVQNSHERCYFCKKRTYEQLMAAAERQGGGTLLDGTNTDDLHEHRPGLKAVREYGVISPFLAAGFSKSDIRDYARQEGLINHGLPSNSCLATRIATGRPITMEMLTVIGNAEEFLLSLGFMGVRVRPEAGLVCLEVQEKDIQRIVELQTKRAIIQYVTQQGLGQPYVGLVGRQKG